MTTPSATLAATSASSPALSPSPLSYPAHALDHENVEQVFVIGTGRCGSTLLSNMLRLHPNMLSLSELFSFISDLGCDVSRAFPDGLVSGEQVWDILAAHLPRQNLMLKHDVAMPEVLYPWQEASRYNAATGVPAISQVCLPHLSQTPDALFDALQLVVCQLPAAPIGVQYQRVFAWLARQYNAPIWLERSGGGLRIVERLLLHFPNARFVHIVRNGPDTALSMSKHRGFRFVFAAFQLLEVLGVDPFVSSDRRWEEDLSDEQAALLPERFTKQAFLEFSTPAPLCGHYWAGEICHGLKLLQDLPAERLLTLRYEDILYAAMPTIASLLCFLRRKPSAELSTGDLAWLTQAAALVKTPTGSAMDLPEKLREQTIHACKPGTAALAASGVQY